jgi:hypothetical protein
MTRTKENDAEEENESDDSEIESEDDEKEDEEKKHDSDDDNSVDDEEEEKDEDLMLERDTDKKMLEDFVSDNDASDVDDEDDEYEDELQKFKDYQVISSLEKQHPEIMQVNYEEVLVLSKVVRNKRGEIIDPLHTTLPILTKYEKARVIGSRAEQINRGAAPSIPVDESKTF